MVSVEPSEQDRSGQVNQVKTGQDRLAQVRKHQDRPGQAKKVGAVKDRFGQIRSDQSRLGQFKRQTRLDRSGQGM